jgi:TonB family protein
MKFSRCIFAVSMLLVALEAGAQAQSSETVLRVAILSFGETRSGQLALERLATTIGSERSILLVDRDLAGAAARGVGYSGSLNLLVPDARDLGAAIGCDFYIIGDAQTVRRSSSTRPSYFESYASIFLVSARTGRLILWERPSFDAPTAEAALQHLLSQIANAETHRHYLVALRRAQEDERNQRQIAGERNTPLIEEAPAEANEQSGLRLPRPYRRLRPAYPDSAARADAEGTVDVLLDLDQEGEVTNVEVARWAGFGLDEATVNTVRQLHFFPALRDGVPIPIRILLRYNFRKPAP